MIPYLPLDDLEVIVKPTEIDGSFAVTMNSASTGADLTSQVQQSEHQVIQTSESLEWDPCYDECLSYITADLSTSSFTTLPLSNLSSIDTQVLGDCDKLTWSTINDLPSTSHLLQLSGFSNVTSGSIENYVVSSSKSHEFNVPNTFNNLTCALNADTSPYQQTNHPDFQKTLIQSHPSNNNLSEDEVYMNLHESVEYVLSTTDDMPTSSFIPSTNFECSSMDKTVLGNSGKISMSAIDKNPLSFSTSSQVWNCSSTIGEGLDINTQNTCKNLTCVSEMHTKPHHQISQQDVPLPQSPSAHSSKDTRDFDDLATSAIEKSQKSKKRTRCKCPNCSVDGGNKTRGSNGKLQHICHYPNCRKVFNDPSHLNRHLYVHTDEKAFACEHCHKRFARRDKLIEHVRFKHTEHTERKDIAKHVCLVADCGKVFRHKGNLKRHLLVHTNYKAFACEECDMRFGREDNLNKHIRSFHIEQSRQNSIHKTYESLDTRETESNEQERLLASAPTQTLKDPLSDFLNFQSAKPQKCKRLRFEFVDVAKKSEDINGELEYFYDNVYCEEDFNNCLNLKNGEKSHFCTWSECGESFVSKADLTLHMKSHENSKLTDKQCSTNNAMGGNEIRDSNDDPRTINCNLLATMNVQDESPMFLHVPPTDSQSPIDSLIYNITHTPVGNVIGKTLNATLSIYQIQHNEQVMLPENQTVCLPTGLLTFQDVSVFDGDKLTNGREVISNDLQTDVSVLLAELP